MSDLSKPPLSLVPLGADASPSKASQEPFAWPTPDLPCYPPPSAQLTPEPCEVEGLNGHVMQGRMTLFSPEDGVLQLQVPPSKTTMPLRFDQFRRIRLLRTVAVQHASGGLPAELSQRPMVPYTITMKDNTLLEGLTIRYAEIDAGVFLFEPVDKAGSVRRVFVPRTSFIRAEMGQKLGEALLEEELTTPAALDEALAEQTDIRSRKLGDILLAKQIITQDELLTAIDQQSKMPMVRIGEALLALGMISEQQLEEALAQQRGDRSIPLGELLVRRGAVSREDLQTALSRKMGYPLVDVQSFPVDIEAVMRLPFAVARRVPALPLLRRAGRLIVAMEDPTRKSALEDVEFAAQCKIVPVLARMGTLTLALDRAYEKTGTTSAASLHDPTSAIEFEVDDASKLLATLEQAQTSTKEDSASDDEPTIEQSDNSLVRLINSMIQEAHAQRVSDIHIECQPGRGKVKIRFRKDGQLRPYMELPHTYRNALIARLKIMCDLDISERRKPQDGKIQFGKFVQGQKLELRVATIPTHSGLEDAVLRLLASAKALPLDNLNLSPHNLRVLKEAMQRPYGMVLCVGPTGSGKTTTLHSAIGYINVPERKIWTAEDPIEITQPGLRQVQVNPKIEWTFAKALRAFLRADPDVIMVGEIRDAETAQIAIEASLTGHLVLSTLHTNSAAETVTRLVDMGMDPFNFADSLIAVLAQRLVRRLCTACRVPREASPEEAEEILHDYMHGFEDVSDAPNGDDVLASWKERFGTEGHLTLYRGVGCNQCDNTGYRGRAGIHELLHVTRGLRQLIQESARSDAIQRKALSEGLRTLRQDGLEKVLAGITSLEEVRANSY
ncbi:MAG: GspE/PulE family protein [Rubrivivax sp.]|jgi:type II secretory ATPase GspE/PulE/Tfp pilus assembly ATPase PilB-like protein